LRAFVDQIDIPVQCPEKRDTLTDQNGNAGQDHVIDQAGAQKRLYDLSAINIGEEGCLPR